MPKRGEVQQLNFDTDDDSNSVMGHSGASPPPRLPHNAANAAAEVSTPISLGVVQGVEEGSITAPPPFMMVGGGDNADGVAARVTTEANTAAAPHLAGGEGSGAGGYAREREASAGREAADDLALLSDLGLQHGPAANMSNINKKKKNDTPSSAAGPIDAIVGGRHDAPEDYVFGASGSSSSNAAYNNGIASPAATIEHLHRLSIGAGGGGGAGGDSSSDYPHNPQQRTYGYVPDDASYTVGPSNLIVQRKAKKKALLEKKNAKKAPAAASPEQQAEEAGGAQEGAAAITKTNASQSSSSPRAPSSGGRGSGKKAGSPTATARGTRSSSTRKTVQQQKEEKGPAAGASPTASSSSTFANPPSHTALQRIPAPPQQQQQQQRRRGPAAPSSAPPAAPSLAGEVEGTGKGSDAPSPAEATSSDAPLLGLDGEYVMAVAPREFEPLPPPQPRRRRAVKRRGNKASPQQGGDGGSPLRETSPSASPHPHDDDDADAGKKTKRKGADATPVDSRSPPQLLRTRQGPVQASTASASGRAVSAPRSANTKKASATTSTNADAKKTKKAAPSPMASREIATNTYPSFLSPDADEDVEGEAGETGDEEGPGDAAAADANDGSGKGTGTDYEAQRPIIIYRRRRARQMAAGEPTLAQRHGTASENLRRRLGYNAMASVEAETARSSNADANTGDEGAADGTSKGRSSSSASYLARHHNYVVYGEEEVVEEGPDGKLHVRRALPTPYKFSEGTAPSTAMQDSNRRPPQHPSSARPTLGTVQNTIFPAITTRSAASSRNSGGAAMSARAATAPSTTEEDGDGDDALSNNNTNHNTTNASPQGKASPLLLTSADLGLSYEDRIALKKEELKAHSQQAVARREAKRLEVARQQAQLADERKYWGMKYAFDRQQRVLERRIYLRELTALWAERTDRSPYWLDELAVMGMKGDPSARRGRGGSKKGSSSGGGDEEVGSEEQRLIDHYKAKKAAHPLDESMADEPSTSHRYSYGDSGDSAMGGGQRVVANLQRRKSKAPRNAPRTFPCTRGESYPDGEVYTVGMVDGDGTERVVTRTRRARCEVGSQTNEIRYGDSDWFYLYEGSDDEDGDGSGGDHADDYEYEIEYSVAADGVLRPQSGKGGARVNPLVLARRMQGGGGAADSSAVGVNRGGGDPNALSLQEMSAQRSRRHDNTASGLMKGPAPLRIDAYGNPLPREALAAQHRQERDLKEAEEAARCASDPLAGRRGRHGPSALYVGRDTFRAPIVAEEQPLQPLSDLITPLVGADVPLTPRGVVEEANHRRRNKGPTSLLPLGDGKREYNAAVSILSQRVQNPHRYREGIIISYSPRYYAVVNNAANSRRRGGGGGAGDATPASPRSGEGEGDVTAANNTCSSTVTVPRKPPSLQGAVAGGGQAVLLRPRMGKAYLVSGASTAAVEQRRREEDEARLMRSYAAADPCPEEGEERRQISTAPADGTSPRRAAAYDGANNNGANGKPSSPSRRQASAGAGVGGRSGPQPSPRGSPVAYQGPPQMSAMTRRGAGDVQTQPGNTVPEEKGDGSASPSTAAASATAHPHDDAQPPSVAKVPVKPPASSKRADGAPARPTAPTSAATSSPTKSSPKAAATTTVIPTSTPRQAPPPNKGGAPPATTRKDADANNTAPAEGGTQVERRVGAPETRSQKKKPIPTAAVAAAPLAAPTPTTTIGTAATSPSKGKKKKPLPPPAPKAAPAVKADATASSSASPPSSPQRKKKSGSRSPRRAKKVTKAAGPPAGAEEGDDDGVETATNGAVGQLHASEEVGGEEEEKAAGHSNAVAMDGPADADADGGGADDSPLCEAEGPDAGRVNRGYSIPHQRPPSSSMLGTGLDTPTPPAATAETASAADACAGGEASPSPSRQQQQDAAPAARRPPLPPPALAAGATSVQSVGGGLVGSSGIPIPLSPPPALVKGVEMRRASSLSVTLTTLDPALMMGGPHASAPSPATTSPSSSQQKREGSAKRGATAASATPPAILERGTPTTMLMGTMGGDVVMSELTAGQLVQQMSAERERGEAMAKAAALREEEERLARQAEQDAALRALQKELEESMRLRRGASASGAAGEAVVAAGDAGRGSKAGTADDHRPSSTYETHRLPSRSGLKSREGPTAGNGSAMHSGRVSSSSNRVQFSPTVVADRPSSSRDPTTAAAGGRRVAPPTPTNQQEGQRPASASASSSTDGFLGGGHDVDGRPQYADYSAPIVVPDVPQTAIAMLEQDLTYEQKVAAELARLREERRLEAERMAALEDDYEL